jgi:hypothetical protein
MKRSTTRVRYFVASAFGFALIAISAAFLLAGMNGPESPFVQRTVGVLKISSARAEAPPTMRQAEVEAIAREAVSANLARTQASAAESGQVYASYNGHPARLEDLDLIQTTFSSEVRTVTSATGGAFEAGRPFNAWTVVFQRSGVAVPEWGLTDGLFESTVIIDDTTGQVRAAGVRVVKPAGG